MLPSSKGTQYVLGMLGRTPEDALCLEDLNATVPISLKAVVRGYSPYCGNGICQLLLLLRCPAHAHAPTCLCTHNLVQKQHSVGMFTLGSIVLVQGAMGDGVFHVEVGQSCGSPSPPPCSSSQRQLAARLPACTR